MFIAFPLQQWLHKRPSILGSTYIAWLVVIGIQEKREWSFQIRLIDVHAWNNEIRLHNCATWKLEKG